MQFCSYSLGFHSFVLCAFRLQSLRGAVYAVVRYFPASECVQISCVVGITPITSCPIIVSGTYTESRERSSVLRRNSVYDK